MLIELPVFSFVQQSQAFIDLLLGQFETAALGIKCLFGRVAIADTMMKGIRSRDDNRIFYNLLKLCYVRKLLRFSSSQNG